ncbi:uncharacterized protein LOC100859819 isoform X3 [Gallus gallus]|uniref:Cocaine- and amphetamine-regulated transcript protein n=1 Tax=Gallus gallus TaxID=9031 RepID=A0A8V1A4R0_CHICK|nr:uncharacterized protein LOC100859819 isoform X3 [Gallus gallus]XP_040548733.1 uncharacterized protein LOC100859819 isoform X3 [Gallus gallus]|eukprot:XP_015155441.1 uncharacterized protein LOC100859819 isoform X2 [Gallus gallus]
MGVRGFAAAWGGYGGCRTTAHLLLPSARSRRSEGPGAAGRGGEEEEEKGEEEGSGLPPSWFCIRALLGLSVHLCVQPCRSTGIKAKRDPQRDGMGSIHLLVLSLLTELLPRGADARGAGVEALQEVLEKLRSRELPPTAKKPGRVPSCHLGEPCAVRVGARYGKRCSCPPGTACNLYVLRCS